MLRMKSVLLLPLFCLLHNFLTTTVYVPIKASISIIFQSNDNDQQQYERISNITNSNAFSPSFSPLSLAAVTQEEEEKEEGEKTTTAGNFPHLEFHSL